MNFSLKGVVSLVAVFAICAVGFWLSQKRTALPEIIEQDSAPTELNPPAQTGASYSPFSVSGSDNNSLDTLSSNNDPVAMTDAVRENLAEEGLSVVDVTSLGRSMMSDEEYLALVERLKSDPQLLSLLIDEVRQETDLERRASLLRIIGAVGGEPATLLASELVFSGDDEDRNLGLDLLQMIQPGDSQARDIVSGMLATEVEPDVLRNTLTALADPGAVDEQSRAYLSGQVAWLTEHTDAGVRSISLDILSRWTTDTQYTSVLLSGLDDNSEYVRASAAYALASHEDQSQEVIDRLMRVIADSSEQEAVRRAAILAVRRMPITDQQRQDVQIIERELNTVVR